MLEEKPFQVNELKKALDNLYKIELQIEERSAIIDDLRNSNTGDYLLPFFDKHSVEKEFFNVVPNYSILMALGAEEAIEQAASLIGETITENI